LIQVIHPDRRGRAFIVYLSPDTFSPFVLPSPDFLAFLGFFSLTLRSGEVEPGSFY
jgi:hypothetical protein